MFHLLGFLVGYDHQRSLFEDDVFNQAIQLRPTKPKLFVESEVVDPVNKLVRDQLQLWAFEYFKELRYSCNLVFDVFQIGRNVLHSGHSIDQHFVSKIGRAHV